jgi:hypothetical protein
MRGRSCWTRRLVLQQRRSGCGRPRKIPSCRLDASWFLAWAKGAIGWQRQETLVEPVDATVCGVLVPEIGWHCQGLLWSYETLLGVSVYQTGAHRMRVQSAAVSTAHDFLVAFPVEEDLV